MLGEERAAELSRLTGMFILRRTQEIINRYLPPRLDWTLFCEPSALLLVLYERLLCHRVFRACLQGTTQTHTHLACITALKKLCNHPGLLHATVMVTFFMSHQSFWMSHQALETKISPSDSLLIYPICCLICEVLSKICGRSSLFLIIESFRVWANCSVLYFAGKNRWFTGELHVRWFGRAFPRILLFRRI